MPSYEPYIILAIDLVLIIFSAVSLIKAMKRNKKLNKTFARDRQLAQFRLQHQLQNWQDPDLWRTGDHLTGDCPYCYAIEKYEESRKKTLKVTFVRKDNYKSISGPKGVPGPSLRSLETESK